jgi:hypothetical protein
LIRREPIKLRQLESPHNIVEGAVLVSREEIERMKVLLDRMLEKVAEREKRGNSFESIHQKIDRLDERVRNVETLLETAVNLIQELIFISVGETLSVKEEHASIKQEAEEQDFEFGENPETANKVKEREEFELEEHPETVNKLEEREEVTRASSWDLLGQRPKVSLHDLERELERLFSRIAEVEVAREENRITEGEYKMMIQTLREKKENITKDLDKLFNTAKK